MSEEERGQERHRDPGGHPRRLPRHLRRLLPPGVAAGIRWDGGRPAGAGDDGGRSPDEEGPG
ncbi:hypothetical protein GCU56_13845 [Geodermatophilus sabuli]|uniref:Uncharacterized protein n=1 Tax=Geodermatophilus sabuli TaxID=1564158 RepID=A0A7K3W230_9ACTN|nr:hypothetical protein [Geodermatophilus sabuli]NEK58949.1 hypothetical protein [Geodermatophilus sabuli]